MRLGVAMESACHNKRVACLLPLVSDIAFFCRHPVMGSMMPMSLLDIAVKKSGEVPENAVSDKRTLIFAGSKSSGKTTMIQRFLEKNEPIKGTLALEFCYGRKSGRSLNKDICHIWELGGGTLFTNLLPTILGPNTRDTALVLVLDLSSPKTIWITLETVLETVFNQVKLNQDLLVMATERVPNDHPDKEIISPFPIPLLIVGSKYDVFLDMDPEDKKNITKTLRTVAHNLAGSLFYYSDRDPTLVKRAKELLNFHGFGGAPWKSCSIEVNKPIIIPAGCDTFENISTNSVYFKKSTGLGLDTFKHAFTSIFNQETEDSVIPDDPAKDEHYRDSILDQLRSHKDEELDRFIQDLETRMTHRPNKKDVPKQS